MDTRRQTLSEKISLYKQLESLAEVNGEEDHLDSIELSQRKKSRDFFMPKPAPRVTDEIAVVAEPAQPPSATTPKRVNSEPTLGDSKRLETIKATPADTEAPLKRRGRGRPKKVQHPASDLDAESITIPDSTKSLARKSVRRSDSTPLPPTKRRQSVTEATPCRGRTAPLNRKKREPSITARPEKEKIFGGLEFFYIPDNDIAPARRLRIAKAIEYGASRTSSVDKATHVVVDKNIAYKDIANIISKSRSDDHSSLVVVNEDYPIDCIQFKALLDHTQKKYLLSGQPSGIAIVAQSLISTVPSSDAPARSLQLKPPHKNPRRWDYVPPGGTPEASQISSSQTSRVNGTALPMDSQPIELEIGPAASASQESLVGENPRGDGNTFDPESAPSAVIVEADENENRPTGSSNDELSDYIALMQEFKDVPLDADEDEDAGEDLDQVSGSDDEEKRKRKVDKSKLKSRSGRKDLRFEERFSCYQGGTRDAVDNNPNARTIEILQKMANYYERINDQWRTMAYRKAISTLKRQSAKVSTEEEALQLPSVGQRLAQKIEEIVNTDRLQRLEYAETEPMDESLQLFIGIYGVGSRQAQQWIAQGFRTLDDLRNKANLTTNQLIGVERYNDLNTKIPRYEVKELGDFVRKTAAEIDRHVELIIGGSYRRGSERSGDIDFIVTKSGTESSLELRPFLDKLVKRLEEKNFLVARLASSRAGSDGSKWHGCCVLPQSPEQKGDKAPEYKPIWRRIDFLVVPDSELGAALLYFTGNDIFNRSMRLLASKKGMRLNQRGLYKDVMRGPGRSKMTEGELIEGRDEKRIFEILGVQWREPHERWC